MDPYPNDHMGELDDEEPGSSEEVIDRLERIQEQIKDLMRDAKYLIRDHDPSPGRHIWERAKGYWYAHITMGLGGEHEYAGDVMVSMENTIRELERALEGDDD